MRDDVGKWVLKKSKYSIFTWDFGRYKKTIAHSENCLPELDIQAVFRNFAVFYKRLGLISRYSTFNFDFSSIYTRDYLRTGKTMDFTP